MKSIPQLQTSNIHSSMDIGHLPQIRLHSNWHNTRRCQRTIHIPNSRVHHQDIHHLRCFHPRMLLRRRFHVQEWKAQQRAQTNDTSWLGRIERMPRPAVSRQSSNRRRGRKMRVGKGLRREERERSDDKKHTGIYGMFRHANLSIDFVNYAGNSKNRASTCACRNIL
jgi:hypothetical protein